MVLSRQTAQSYVRVHDVGTRADVPAIDFGAIPTSYEALMMFFLLLEYGRDMWLCLRVRTVGVPLRRCVSACWITVSSLLGTWTDSPIAVA